MKSLVLVNQHLGSGISPGKIDHWKKQFGEKEWFVPQSLVECKDLLKSKLEGINELIIIGGDGTLHTAVNSLYEGEKLLFPQLQMSLAKGGSGGDYYRSLFGFKGDRVDVGYYKGDCEEGIFLNALSGGIGAELIKQKNLLPKKFPGTIKYLLSSVLSLIKGQSFSVKLRANDQVIENQLLCLMLHKGKYAGGGMTLAPSAKLDDGFFEITMIESMSAWSGVCLLPSVYSGHYKKSPKIRTLKCSSAEFSCLEGVPLEADGEDFPKVASKLKVKVLPRSLKIKRAHLFGPKE